MKESSRNILGTILGASIITASGIATAAAIIGPRSRWDDDPLFTGIIPGYATYSGSPYSVYRQIDEDMFELIAQPVEIWFEHTWDYYKYEYDYLRQFGLTVRGCYVAIGHSRKAGVHSSGKKTGMRGYNNWGVKAGLSYRRQGNLFYIADTVEYLRKEGIRKEVIGAKWRFFSSMNEAIDSWLHTMRGMYPIAYAELFKKNPDPYRYHDGLESGKGGAKYATGSFNMGDLIDASMTQVPKQLNEHFGYNLPVG